jgi:hypothetical protein
MELFTPAFLKKLAEVTARIGKVRAEPGARQISPPR